MDNDLQRPREPLVPMISASVADPLGVVHLPRLWLKLYCMRVGGCLQVTCHGADGFDELLLTSLGIEPQDFIDYIERETPDYLTLEDWVREHARNCHPKRSLAAAISNSRVARGSLTPALSQNRT